MKPIQKTRWANERLRAFQSVKCHQITGPAGIVNVKQAERCRASEAGEFFLAAVVSHTLRRSRNPSGGYIERQPKEVLCHFLVGEGNNTIVGRARVGFVHGAERQLARWSFKIERFRANINGPQVE